MKDKAVVLMSGGQDSTVCLLMAINEYGKENIEAISFMYNHQFRRDVECAKKICKDLQVSHSIYDAGVLYDITNSKNMEGRNLVLISLAAIFANTKNITNIYVGVAKADSECQVRHPDCTEQFIDSIETSIRVALGVNIRIITPLIYLDKMYIWEIADSLGYLSYIENETFSCWKSKDKHCMVCEACQLRFKGLEQYKEFKYGKK